MVIKVLIGAAGSGGHLFPAQQLKSALSDCEVLFAGHKLEGSPFFDSEKIPFQEISSAPLKRGFFKAVWKGFWQSAALIRSFHPDVVVGFGSYHTFPLLLAATLMGKKIILFEANTTLGKVNRLLAPFAKKIAFQFSYSHKKAVLVPFLPWGIKKEAKASVEKARQYFGLDSKKTTLLVFGGSQGASFLNREIPAAIDRVKGEIQVIHVTGKGGGSVCYKSAACVKEFEKEMSMAYIAADAVICRSGAGTIAELIQYQVPALLIPFPNATEDHQRKNGEFLVQKTQGARLLLQRDATLDRLVFEIESLLKQLDSYRSGLKTYALQQEKRIDFSELVRSMGGKKT